MPTGLKKSPRISKIISGHLTPAAGSGFEDETSQVARTKPISESDLGGNTCMKKQILELILGPIYCRWMQSEILCLGAVSILDLTSKNDI